MSFETTYKHAMAIEKGYANSSNDKGGETYKGISRVANPQWEGWPIIDVIKKQITKPFIDNLSSWKLIDTVATAFPELEDMAKDYYKANYYAPVEAWGFSERLTDKLFDMYINMSPKSVIKTFQKAINVTMDHVGRISPHIQEDGKMGPATKEAARGLPEERLLRIICDEQWEFYQKGVVKAFPKASPEFKKRAMWVPE